jgi:hypothetical protein
MKKQTKSIVNELLPPDPAKDLTGKRFGKWVVLKYAGKEVYLYRGVKHFLHRWLCRCECGVENTVIQGNLLSKHSRQCFHCANIGQGIECRKLFLTWQRLKQLNRLPKEWQEYDAFSRVVGEPPADAARLARCDITMPHGPDNTYWAMSSKDHHPKQIPEDFKEKYIFQNKELTKVRNAETKDEMIQGMIAARKAGYTYEWIGIAAGFTRQWVHQIIAKHFGKQK